MIPRALTVGSFDNSAKPQRSTAPVIKIAIAVYLNIFIFFLPFVIDKKDVSFYDILYFLLIIVFEPLVEFVVVDDG